MKTRLAAVVAPFCLWLALASVWLHSGNRMNTDSADYIDCARSIRDGRGFLTRAWGGTEGADWTPLAVFPPGYPLLVSGAMAAGLSPHTAALAVATVSTGLFVLLALIFLARQLPPLPAAAAGAVFVAMRPLLMNGTMCISEGPCLLFTLLSLFALVRAMAREEPSSGWLLAAGLAGGFAWCVRNAAIALFAASALFLALQWFRFRTRRTLAAGAAWAAGWLLASSWLIARNLRTFGRLLPYEAPPSEWTVWKTARETLGTLLTDLSGLGSDARWLTTPFLVAAGLLLLAAAVLKVPFSELFRNLRERRERLLLALFAATHLLVVVAARSTYRWADGGKMDSRHFLPVYWILLLFAALAAMKLARRASRTRPAAGVALAASLLAALALLQVRPTLLKYLRPRDPKPALVRAQALELGRQIPADRIVLSDAVDALRVFGNVNARFPARAANWGETPLNRESLLRAGRLWGVVMEREDAFRHGDYGPYFQSLLADPASHPELVEQPGAGPLRVFERVP